MEDKKILNLLNENALELLQKRGFTGRLIMKWKNGKVIDFNLINSIRMSVQRDLFPFPFFDFDGDEDEDDDLDEL
jgi:hypothetical protein